MENSITLGTSQRSTRVDFYSALHVLRYTLGGISLVLGLLFCTGAEENIGQAFFALALIITSGIPLGAFEKKGGAA